MAERSASGAPVKRVLVVEDEPLVRDLVALNLGHAGYDVSTAATYADGLAHATSGRFDLAIVDVMLPGGDYEEIHAALDSETARALTTGPITEAIPTRHGDGWRTPLDVLRVGLAHAYARGARRSAADAPPAALPRSLAGSARRS